VLVGLTAPRAVAAQPAIGPALPGADPAIVRGYTLLHDGDRTAAIRHFTTLADANPNHLGARFGRAFAELETIAFDERLQPPYEARLDALIDDADRRHRANAEDVSAHFYLAQAYMLRATYRFEHDKGTWGAARDGASAKRYSESYLSKHPSDADAHLTLGLYNYFVDIIPRAFRILRFLLFLPSGDRTAGLRQIERAAASGGIFAFRAQMVLIEIYGSLEGRPADALALAERRHTQHPRNDDAADDLARLLAGPAFEERERAAGLYLEIIDRRAKDATPEGYERRYRALLALAGTRADQWRVQEAIDVLNAALASAPRAPEWIQPSLRLLRGNYRSLVNDPRAGDDSAAVLANADWKQWHQPARTQAEWITKRAANGEAATYAALIPGNRLALAGRWAEAKQLYDAIQAAPPHDAQVRFRRAHLQFLQGDAEAALPELIRLGNTRTAPTWLRAGALLDAARAHDLAGRRDAATRLYDHIVDEYEGERPADAARLGLIAPYRRPSPRGP
jgi:hypothetical protein